jgi:hypothetical protein
MKKKYNKQIELLLGLGLQDIEQSGDVSIRQLSIKADGTENMFPPPETNGVSLNLHTDSARMDFKRIMQLRVEQGEFAGFLLLHNNIITKLGDLLEKPDGQSLYVSCMTVDGKILIKQDYTTNEAGKPVIGERTVIDHDPEDEFLVHGFLAEMALSMPDEMFAKVPQETFSESFPQEWIDYIHRERENRDEDEWYSPKREPDSSDPDTEQGGSHEVLAAEETV